MDARIHSEHVQVIKCDISPKLVKTSKDVKNESISEKIQSKYLWSHF